MNASRIRVGIAVGVLGLAFATGTAGALEGSSCSGCPGDVAPETATQQPTGDVLPANEVQPASAAPASVEAASQSAPATALAFTGGDVLGLTVLGGIAIGAGAVLVRRSRATS